MPKLRVTSSQLRTTATELENKNADLRNQRGQLAAKQEELKSQWKGDANDAFNVEFQEDLDQMRNFDEAVVQYVEALRTMADNYDQAEEANTQTAKSRTYG